MNRKIFLGAGAFLLTFVGVAAGRATMKRAEAQGLYYKTQVTSGACKELVGANVAFVTGTSYAAANQIQLVTAGGVSTYPIFGTSTCGKNAYFIP
jgi:hypothetical protein